MTRLSKSISFSVSSEDKIVLKKKANDLGLSMSAMIRNIILEKYIFLQLGYMQPMAHDIDIKRLRPPLASRVRTKEQISMIGCITDLKSVFTKGINILENMEKADLMVKGETKEKTDEELKQAVRDKNIRIFLKKMSYAHKILLSKY